jgi:uncharacterized protein (DUF2267 family)
MGQPVNTMNHDQVPCSMEGRVIWPDEQMAELLVLLPGRQAAELEWLACTLGLTVGHLIRLLIHDYLTDGSGPGSVSKQQRRRAMTQTGLAPFDSTLQTTNVWLNDILERLGWEDRHRAYHALRAVLHALRDRLPVDQAAALAAQLPMLVRGFYYEGWHPHGKPVKERHREEFLAHIAAAFREDPEVDPERVTRAVLQVLSKHVTGGEIEAVKRSLPTELRSLWG